MVEVTCDKGKLLRLVLVYILNAPAPRTTYSFYEPTTGLCGDLSEQFSGVADKGGRRGNGEQPRSQWRYGCSQRVAVPLRSLRLLVFCAAVGRQLPRRRKHLHLS